VGTGKSHLISCYRDFARRWDLWHTVSGIAATLIDGLTIHSALGVSVTLDPHDPVSKHLRAWEPIDTVIVDEFMMNNSPFLALMESRLQLLKQNKLPFGGVHMIAFGDFYHLEATGSHMYGTNLLKMLSARRKNMSSWLNVANKFILLCLLMRSNSQRWSGRKIMPMVTY
jgi:hypothetical protein